MWHSLGAELQSAWQSNTLHLMFRLLPGNSRSDLLAPLFRSLPSFLGGDSIMADEREGYDELELASESDPAAESVTKRMVSFSKSGPEAEPNSPSSPGSASGRPLSSEGPPVRKAVSYSFNMARTGITQDEVCPRELSHTSWWKKVWKQMVIKSELEESNKAKGDVHWVEIWDLSMTVLCFFVAYYVPWEFVSFSEEKKEWPSLRVINRLLNLTFTCDIVLNFFVACSNPSGDLSQSLWQTDPIKIASFYMAFPMSQGGLAGWFWIDMVAVLPGWYHFYCLLVHGDPFVRSYKFLELGRALKLYRMLNLPRLMRFVSRWHAQTGFSFHLVDFWRFLFVTTLTAHLMACTWIAIEGKVTRGHLSYYTNQETWLSVLIAQRGDPCSPSAEQDSVCVYFLALYWSTMTLTTVGYGDITPQNLPEYFVCTASMLVSGFVWAYLVGSVVSLIQGMDLLHENFKHQMDDLNEMMSSRNLPHDLRVKLRRFMHEAKPSLRQESQVMLLKYTISEGLQREVAMHSAKTNLLQGIYWADNFEAEARMSMVKAFRLRFFGPSEVIMLRQCLLVLQKGILAVLGRILRRGDVWGTECILLESEHLIESAQPRTLSYTSVMCMERSDLLEIARSYPSIDPILRKSQVRAAVRRALFLNAVKVKAEQARKLALESDGTRSTGRHYRSPTASPLVARASSIATVAEAAVAAQPTTPRRGSFSALSLLGDFDLSSDVTKEIAARIGNGIWKAGSSVLHAGSTGQLSFSTGSAAPPPPDNSNNYNNSNTSNNNDNKNNNNNPVETAAVAPDASASAADSRGRFGQVPPEVSKAIQQVEARLLAKQDRILTALHELSKNHRGR
ncbi:unnamed protein product [Polarella glacialis]|uniref:Ion transport domain-containing protein n=1 Tax=Polarella glacialis TaxID=89957 RepID=A0A813I389_POLGL|nr:unnamed protein product [Polarella glacialis]